MPIPFNGEEFHQHLNNYASYTVLQGMLDESSFASSETRENAQVAFVQLRPAFLASLAYLRDISDGYVEDVPEGVLPGENVPPSNAVIAQYAAYLRGVLPDEAAVDAAMDIFELVCLWRADYLAFMRGEFDKPASGKKRQGTRGLPREIFAVHSSEPVYDIGETIARGVFALAPGARFPSAEIMGKTSGRIELLPFWDHKNNRPLTPQVINLAASTEAPEFGTMQQEALQIATSYNEEMATYFYAMDAYWLMNAKDPDDYVEVQISDLLRYTGKKPVKTHGKYTGTFRPDQLKQAGMMVYGMGFSMVEIDRAIIKGVGERVHYKRLWDVSDMYVMRTLDAENYIESMTYRPNEFFRNASFGTRRETALLMSKVLGLDYAKMVTARRLGRYYTWLWRDRARSGQMDAPVRCEKLLERASVPVEKGKERYARRQLETALDRLETEGIISQWVLLEPDGSPANLEERISFPRWLEMKISVSPPDTIVQHYAGSLTLPRDEAPRGETLDTARLRAERKRCGFTLAMLSEATGVELSTLSRIEAGKTKRPRAEHVKAINKWLAQQEEERVREHEHSGTASE